MCKGVKDNAIKDISIFSSIRKLDLISCCNIVNVDSLKRVCILNLNSCCNIKNVDNLHNVTNLNLCEQSELSVSEIKR